MAGPPPEDPHAMVIEMRRPEAMRWLLIIASGGLAAVCLLIAVAALSGSLASVVLMGAFGLAMAWFARALILSDAACVMFDGERVFDDAGTEICRLDDIVQVERGLAFFKPSSGFVLMMTDAYAASAERAWAPGLWWRIGRRIGVGGAVPGRAGRNMADAIMGALAARAAPPQAALRSGE